MGSTGENSQSAAKNSKEPCPCWPENFASIVEGVVNPARNGNKTMYHSCCRAFSKRCRPKKNSVQDPVHEHLKSTNLKSIFNLTRKLTIEEAWKQFVEWSEKSSQNLDLQTGFLVNQKTCLRKLEDLQKMAAETEFLRAQCQYVNPLAKDALVKSQIEEIEELKTKLTQKEQECKEHERKRAEKNSVIHRQKKVIKKLEESLLANSAQANNKFLEFQDPLTSKLHSTFQRLMKKCDRAMLLTELAWLEEFVEEKLAPTLEQAYHQPSTQLQNMKLCAPTSK